MDQPARFPSESRERGERAVSSDPCATRPNPFDDDGSSARKRRRTSLNGASPSRSVETPQDSLRGGLEDWPVDDKDASMTMDSTSSPPQTPEREHRQVESQPASETRPTKITLNLKHRKRTPGSELSSPISRNGADTEPLAQVQENGIRASVEDSDLDVSHASPDFDETASAIDLDNPPIEILDSEYVEDVLPHVTILQDTDPMVTFPYQPNEPLSDSLPRLCQLIANKYAAPDHQALTALHGWIEEYLAWASAARLDAVRELYLEYREFWVPMPQLIYTYTSPARNVHARNLQLSTQLYEFHASFARLTTLFIELDLWWIDIWKAREDEEDLELASVSFIAYLQAILRDYIGFAPNTVLSDVDSVWPEPIAQVVEAFRAPHSLSPQKSTSSSAHDLHKLGLSLVSLVPRYPKLIDHLGGIAQLAAFVARDHFDQSISRGSGQAKSVLAQGFALYEAVTRLLVICIEKSVNHIAAQTAVDLLHGLSNLLEICLREDSEQAQHVVNEHRRRYPRIPPTETIRVIACEWRLATLSRLIMSSQMQLRIQAAQQMCQDLVQVHKEHNRQPVSLQPVLRHFSDQLLQSGVVAYVLGPTCHPEVTAQSFNIVGFLFASHTFTPELMDLMWRTITTCQISGVAEGLLAMLCDTVQLWPEQDSLCMFQKLQTVSIESFTPALKEFCDRLLVAYMGERDVIHDSLPYSLMFRLLRESSVPGPQSYKAIQKWASTLISHLLRFGPTPEDRQSLQKECLKDIAGKTRSTLGSLHALSLLCKSVTRERDLQQLTSQYNLPQLLVDELEHAIDSREDAGILHTISGPENAPRLELLTKVIFQARDRDVIPKGLGRKLWELLVGQRAASQEDRDCAWHSLSVAMQSGSDTPFLHTCFTDYFPTLPPELFRTGSLDFILQKIVPLVNGENIFLLDDVESSEYLAIEQLWRIALTAPGGTIEQRAIAALVKDVYMENRSIRNMPAHRARKIHLALVDRCMRQLCSAAKYLTAGTSANENETDAITAAVDGQQITQQESLFTRSLIIVKDFHKIHQQTPHFSSPDMRSLDLPKNINVEGDSAELKYQSFDGDTQTDVKPLAIGRRNTARSLLASLRDATGFENYRMYYKGQHFTPSEKDICKSLEDLHIHSGLILVKRETEGGDYPVHVRPGASPVEIEIMRHFEELWQYLGLEEKLATEIYYFLITLPVDEQILELVRKETTTYEHVFPIGHPLKSLYALHALREYLCSQCSPTGTPQSRDGYSDALRRALGLVVSAISDREVTDNGSSAHLRAAFASKLVEQLFMILRDPLRPSSTNDFLTTSLMERLLEMLTSFRAGEYVHFNPGLERLVTLTFRTIMDACSLKKNLWDWLVSSMPLLDIVQQLLIDDARPMVRRATAQTLAEKTAHSLSSPAVTPTEFRDLFWPMLVQLVPHALGRPTTSQDIFNLAVAICKEFGPQESHLANDAKLLGGLLVHYIPSEVPGMALAWPRGLSADPYAGQNALPGIIDWGAHGLVALLHKLLRAGRHHGVSNSLPVNYALQLFFRFLFPRSWTGRDTDLLWRGGLIYHETTRSRLNDIVLKLVDREPEQLKLLFRCLDMLVPCKTDDEYDPDTALPYNYDLPPGFDRAKEIRAACGYAGLRNLSNTCYLNSLCMQLFMNFDFRQFILAVDVDRRDHSRTLLRETQFMFAQLQSSYHRFVDPEAFVASIKTYDDDMINIHNQMDVEEFFNLLNDRWEGQLRSPDAVRRFRQFYGGQLVTQTKSKECDHISEVTEPFSAIQCDIKGKKNLFESLEAYVDGEHMEGDNKYKCSGCDRHVDAVRRSCLKEIPDSLIFHLKRFDFNLRTQSRSKINDHFAFPDRINMRPYTIDHLNQSVEGDSEDWFELVGVLVHAGTAESGHYYSYIRERSTSSNDDSWFEFNDDVVTPWQPSKLEACCFGGIEGTWDAGVTYEKNYCAYMLFYERSSTLEMKQQELQRLNLSSPRQATFAPPLMARIRDDNLRTLQRHCLFDPDHIRLVDDAIEQMLDLNNGECSDDHEMETLAISAAIGHWDQIASRAQDVPDAQKIGDRITELADNCTRCAFAVYDYFSRRRHVFQALIQRNPEVAIRRSAVDLLGVVLRSIRREGKHRGTLDLQEDILDGVSGMFEPIWRSFHVVRLHKSWPEVFGMMSYFVNCGKEELLAFLNQGFLHKTLLIFVSLFMDEHERDGQFHNLCSFLIRRPNRQPPFAPAIELLSNILTQVTMVNKPVRNFDERSLAYTRHPEEPLRVTEQESDALCMTLEVGGNALMDRIITINQNAEATDAIVAHVLKDQWPLEEDLLHTLLFNTTSSDNGVYAPYLRVAAIFCRLSYNAERIGRLIGHIAHHSKIMAASEPKAVWGFFKDTMDGPRQHSGESKIVIQMQCLQHMSNWLPVLLAHYDSDLSHQAETLLNEKIFKYGVDPQIDDEYGGRERAEAMAECARRIGAQTVEYVHDIFIRRRQAVPASTVAVVQRVMTNCGKYFDSSDDGDPIKYNQTIQGILEALRGLSVEDLEDDGSGMFSDNDSLFSGQSESGHQELTCAHIDEEWENSAASSDQAESLADEEMKDLDL